MTPSANSARPTHLDRRPEMLFNIAQVYRLGNHKQPAVDYYQQYLAAQPERPGAREARQ